MKSERLGKNIAIISAAALILAACSSTPGPETDTSSTDTSTDQTQTDTGQPSQPDMGQVTQDTLDPIEVQGQEGLTAYAGDRVFFEYDSSEITAEARATLSKQAAWLGRHPRVRITIEGHCDERGTREYNLALGERRASAVKNYLIALGVPASRMNTISYGKERPAVVGNGESTWSQNRRGVLRVQ
ncbi:peptidoglycan-associated lipoprotein Pal [Kordiimonas lacus]|uniref:Peptidoglycan-associated lipoprotein n=1 Tax=Kordiimonas lacus TaxID=637679 RepID=A0A1G7DGI7_9PROT|nr:peptidoglycan-associated lipoprotein Pal [Kordiimonas lacus]SDE50688.1 peptidoglycan-associated lipoprotein [Kordiimonas lacus]